MCFFCRASRALAAVGGPRSKLRRQGATEGEPQASGGCRGLRVRHCVRAPFWGCSNAQAVRRGEKDETAEKLLAARLTRTRRSAVSLCVVGAVCRLCCRHRPQSGEAQQTGPALIGCRPPSPRRAALVVAPVNGLEWHQQTPLQRFPRTRQTLWRRHPLYFLIPCLVHELSSTV